MYWPQYGINVIGNLIIGEGYQIKLTSALTMTVEGIAVEPENSPIIIPQGWSFLGYLRQNSAPLVSMMNPIIPDIIIIKNSIGSIYWPQWGINFIENLIPGEGYQIKMNSSQTLTYPGQTGLPYTITTNITNITQSSATGGGQVSYDGGFPVTARGICWNTIGNPTLLDSVSVNGDGVGLFICNIIGLLPDTIYYLRAYATNSTGTAYGNEVTFSTLALGAPCAGMPGIIDIDYNLYNTVQIGSQCWMKENLRSTHYSNGTAVPYISSGSAWALLGATDKAYCYHDNSLEMAAIYGALYTWAAVMNNSGSSNNVPSGVQGICPIGWHVPSDEEWKILEGEVDSLYDYPDAEWDDIGGRGYDAGFNLRATYGWHNEVNGPDLYGFSALPGGGRHNNGQYFNDGWSALWWSTTQYSSIEAWGRHIYYEFGYIGRSIGTSNSKDYGRSVRCLRNPGTPQPGLPVIYTDSVNNISFTSALGGGMVAYNGGSQIIDRGICWNTTGNPTLSDTFTVDSLGTGYFTSILTGLSPYALYYVKAYATNSLGTAYGQEISFISFYCGISTVADYEGNIYNTVKIGNQCWMKENMRTTHYSDGTSIQNIASTSDWEDLLYTDKAYCHYNNDSTNANTFGLLYTWLTAMNGSSSSSLVPSGVQGICPVGWHIPSEFEWMILEGEVDSLYDLPSSIWISAGWRGYDAGLNLKATTGWDSGGNGTDLYGFSAKPGGHRSPSGNFGGINSTTTFWTSYSYYSQEAYFRSLSSTYDQIRREDIDKNYGISVRCLKD